ncbi:MAG: hypothetical protein H6594_01560 [Flavobacteriales bacterium]|nr:hypothetical protein [Flavobacteriales bacterium]
MVHHRLNWTLAYLFCITALMGPAIWNGYPLLYSDSATYVVSGMRAFMPPDRPITYGLFIRITSLGGFTLWTTIACQAAITVRLIELVLRRVVHPGMTGPWTLVITIGILSITTGLPWVVSQVMADIFSPLLLLCMVLLFLPSSPRPPTYQRVLLYGLFTICVAAHLSHLVQTLLLLMLLLLVRLGSQVPVVRRIPLRPVRTMTILALLTYPITMYATALSGNVYFMGAMVEHGIAKAFLERHCEQEDLKLCAWKDDLPDRSYAFVWDREGPIGSYSGWQEASDEFGRIIRASFMDTDLLVRHIRISLEVTWQQLGMYAIGDGWGPFREGSHVYRVLKAHMRHDMAAFTSSRQYNGRIGPIDALKPLHSWMVRISWVALVPLIVGMGRSGRIEMLVLVLTLLVGILITAWGGATFSGALDRFGCKTIWLVCLLALAGTLLPRTAKVPPVNSGP